MSGANNGWSASSGLGLGLDVGGTQSRWALADAGGALIAEGSVGGFSGQQAGTAAGRDVIAAELSKLLAAVTEHGLPERAWAGVTGHEAQAHAAADLHRLLAAALRLDPRSLALFNDVEMAARLCFEPGGGYLVYAGTGSIGLFVDEHGAPHRVGGRGGLLGDEGSGYWIARQALAALWRGEDDAPGSAAASALGRAFAQAMGGGDWATVRRFIHEADRGRFGRLALAVAAAARDGEARSLALLREAGRELARLARLLIQRHGPRPLRVAGRVVLLHDAVAEAMREALPPGTALELRPIDAARDAARRAAAAAAVPAVSPASRPSV
jgi:glucosamine kinase